MKRPPVVPAPGPGPLPMTEPRPLGHALSRVVGSMTSSQGPMVQLLECWDAEVGAQVARHCRPRRLDEARLLVEVDDPTWATQLRFLSAEIVDRLNARLGAGTVATVDVRVAGRRR